MAYVADELDQDDAERRARPPEGFDGFPDIVSDPRKLRVVPWAGEGPDPLEQAEA